MKIGNGMQGLLTSSMMTPMERAKGRFMRAPDGHKGLTQADIDAAVTAAVAKVQESVDKLTEKNQQLIGENRKLKSAGEIKPEDLAAAEDRADKAEAALAEAAKQVKTLTGERDKATKALETESGFTQKLLIQDGLKSALIANGVKDEDYLNMAVASFIGSASVKVDGETRIAMIGDKPLADAIKDWAATDAGKKVVSAPVNSGGGAPGGKGGSSGKTMASEAFNALQPKERAAFMADGGALTE